MNDGCLRGRRERMGLAGGEYSLISLYTPSHKSFFFLLGVLLSQLHHCRTVDSVMNDELSVYLRFL